MASDLTFTGAPFASLDGTNPTSLIPAGTPFFIEANVSAAVQEEFDEGEFYSLNVKVTNFNGAVILNQIITGSLGDANWPNLTSKIQVSGATSGAVVGDIYDLRAVLLSGRRNQQIDKSFVPILATVI